MKARFLQNHEIDKNEWDSLVFSSLQGSVFIETGFMDVILRQTWQGIVVHDNENTILAVMPLNIKNKLGIQYALQPFFAKYWGIAFANWDFKNTYHQYSWKKKVVAAIVDCIPKNIKSINYNFHSLFDYPLPFYWQNFYLQTKYTFRLNVAGLAEEEIFKNYTDSLKNSIRTAQKNNINIVQDSSAEALIHVLSENVKAGKEIMDSKHYPKWNDLFAWANNTGKGFSLTALDDKNIPIASSFYLRDNKYSYALTHNVLYTKRGTDAQSLLVHNAILFAAKSGLNFDFLGSMMEPVEAFNRRFGSQPVPYLNISKSNKLISFFVK